MRIFVTGYSRDGRGARVAWSQMAKDMEHAETVKKDWERAGIQGIEIITR